MDTGGPIKRGTMMDVTPPGATPAAPSSKPVFTNHQQLAPDPMMSGKPTPFDAPTDTTNPASQPISVVDSSPEPVTAIEPAAATHAPVPAAETSEPVATPVQGMTSQGLFEPQHKLSHDQPMFGQFKKPGKFKKVLIFLLVLIVLGGLGGGGYWYMNKSKNDISVKTPASATTDTTQKKTTTETTTDKQLFTSKLSNFSISNKYDWKVTETDTSTTKYADQAKQFNTTYSTVEFAINDKQKLSFEANPGGRGGDCTPKTGDKPFVKGNYCGSYRAIQADKLPDASYPKDKRWDGAVAAYIVRYQVMEPTIDDGTTYTLVGIVDTQNGADGKEAKIELNKDSMGAIWDRTPLPLKMEKGYIDIVISDNNGKLTQLSAADLDKVTEVLKTFKLI